MESAIGMTDTTMDAILEDILDEVQTEERFTITDDHKAEWAIKKIKVLQAKRDRLIDACDRQIAEYEAFKERENTRYTSKTSYLKALLASYFETVPHDATKTAEKYRLPSGELIRKHQNPEIIKEESVAVSSLRAMGMTQYIKTKETVDWAELKPNVDFIDGQCVNKETGEVISGFAAIEMPDVFEVKINV